MKTAYELALERMEAQGIDKPDVESLSETTRAAMAEVRQKAEARLAEADILHQKALVSTPDPGARSRLEAEYRIDRRRIEEDRDRAIQKLRQG